MALSNVLQFDCYIDNEIARNATKNFAGMLGGAFEQYKKLWNEYLKLRNYCEDADFKIPFQLLESDNYNMRDVIGSNTSNESYENLKTSEPLYRRIHTTCGSEIASDSDDNVFANDKFIEHQTHDDSIFRSPILIKKRSSSKKRSVPFAEECPEQNRMHPHIPIKENINILTDSPERNILPVIPKENKNHSDKVECRHNAKTSAKLGISTLYNVDTTLLQNGKKLRQARIVFVPDKRSVDTADSKKHKKSEPLRSHVSPTPEKNVKGISKHQNKLVEEEIIQSSPTKRARSNLKAKSLKFKRKESNTHDEFSDKSRDDKPVAKEMDQSNLNLNLHPASLSAELDQPCSTRKSKTYGSHSENIENDYDVWGTPFSPSFMDIEKLSAENADNLSMPIEETKKLEIKENIKTENEEHPESVSQMLSNTFLGNDETFCLLGEQLKKENNSHTNSSRTVKENIAKTKTGAQLVKKKLMSSFDIPPEKEEVHFDKPSKKQSERAKMAGITCWECKKYYSSLGLSEKEIQTRQNQCSRHRTRYNERADTPAGFWDHLFPDTFSSSLQQ